MNVHKLLSACCPFLMAPQMDDEDVYFAKRPFDGFSKLECEAEAEAEAETMHDGLGFTTRQPKAVRPINVVVHEHVAGPNDGDAEEIRTYDLNSYRMNDAEGAALVDEILELLF